MRSVLYKDIRHVYGVRMKVSTCAEAALPSRPCDLIARQLDSGVAVVRPHPRIQLAAASRSALELGGYLQTCAAAPPPTNVRKTWSSCSDLLSLLALLAVAMRSTSSRSTMSGSDSFMEHCGCAKAHQWRCGTCLLYTSPSPRDRSLSRMPSSA